MNEYLLNLNMISKLDLAKPGQFYPNKEKEIAGNHRCPFKVI